MAGDNVNVGTISKDGVYIRNSKEEKTSRVKIKRQLSSKAHIQINTANTQRPLSDTDLLLQGIIPTQSSKVKILGANNRAEQPRDTQRNRDKAKVEKIETDSTLTLPTLPFYQFEIPSSLEEIENPCNSNKQVGTYCEE